MGREMIELKTVVVLNDEIINVGDWDYQEGQNPLPTGARVEEREMYFTEENGWREVSWTPVPTKEEILEQELARTNGMILELTELILGGM